MWGSMHCRLEVPVQVRFPTLRQTCTRVVSRRSFLTWASLAPVVQHPSITQPPALHQP